MFLAAAATLLASAAYAALPPSPTVTVEAGFGQVTLSWPRVVATPRVQKYQVRYGFNNAPDGAWQDVPGGAGAGSHTVTGLGDGMLYVFHVRAVNADGYGPLKESVVSTLAPNVETPSGFTATGGFRKLDLSWTAAGSLVTVERYQYRLSTDSGDNWSPGWTDIPSSNDSTTSHTVTGLPDATDYTVELRIRAGSVRSDAARTTARTNNLPSGYKGPPGAPTDLTVTLSHGCHVDLDWSAPLSDGGKAIAKYQQRTRKGNGSFGPWQTDLGNPLATYVTLAAATSCDYSYTFQVRAVNTQAGPRASITFTPLDDGPPNEPVDLVAVGGIQRVALSWKTSATTLNQVTYYQVRYRNDRHPDNPWTSWARIPNSNYRTTRHTVTGLAFGAPYILEVRAVNSRGSGASAQQRARTQAEPAQAPAGFTATAGIRKVDLRWTAAASTVAVEAYQYRLSTDGGDNWSPEWTDIPGSSGSTTRHTVSRLANRTAYTVELRIRAGTTHSNAASGSATTPDVPSRPVLSAMSGQRSITLTWTTPHNGGRAISRYQYRRTRISPGFIPWTNIRGSGPNTTSYTHSSGLSDEGRRFTFEVRAVNAVGNSRAGSVDGRTAVSGDPRRPTIRTWFAIATEGRNAAVDFSVQLHPAASSTVRVDYRTEDRSATAPADYQATAGTLTFAPGETEKTLSVPIVDDTVEDSGESFWLLLSHVSGARLGVKRTFGRIYNHEDVLAGFTLVDAAAGTDVGALTDGIEVTLDAPATGQYGVRVETLPEAAIRSLRLELSGAKAVTRTDNAAPYTLYSEGGEGLPQGAYTLRATAYPDPEGGGTALQTLSVSFTVTAAEAASNTAPTGLPEISGTAQVGEVLTASVDGIADEDGLDDVTFAYQWLANGGTDDGEIAGAAGTTHEVGPAEVGKALKVRVTFTDGGDTEETLTSVATEVVSARAPDAPGGLAAAPAAGREGELDVTWTAPASDGGSEVTGYKVQWKSGAEAYDGSETSTRRAVLSDPAVLTHRIEGLTVGTAYTVRVSAVNDAGDGAPAEAEATARDRVVPVLTASSVNGTVLTLTFSEALDADSRPAAVAFAVTVADDARAVDAVALTGSAVELTLASAVASGEAVTVGYTAPTGANASPLKDAAGNAVAGFTGEAVSNETAALPVVSITAGAGPVTEGAYATFTLTRTGSVSAAQTVTVEVAESGAVLAETSPEAVTFEAESATAALDLATADDEVMEDASTVTVTVAAGDGWTVDAEAGSATVTAEDDDAAPVVTTSSPIEAPENDTAVATLEATDADTPAADLVWSLAGGADEDKFAVTAVGALAFKAAKDYESPDDADGDGAYEVTVRVTDGANPVDAALKVTLADEDEVAPTLASASVNGTALTLTFSETLDEGSEPGTSAFGVAVSGAARQVTEVALSGSAAELTLATAVGPGETVTVGYTAPAGPDASPLKDAAGNAVAEFTGEAVSNETPALENSAPAGLPEISGTAKVGETLAASVDDIADADGLDDVTFAYQWLANGGTDDSEIAGAAGTTHEVGPAEVGRTLKVRVTFTDNGDTQETLTSVATEEVVAAPAEVSVRAEAAYVEEGSDAVFTLTRSGPVAGALTVTVAIEESGTMLAETHPANSAFAAGEREVELAVPTVDDGVQESDSAVTARVVTGTGYGPSANFGSASVTVLDDDDDDVASPVSAGETLWSAEMQVVEITSVVIGAARADLFSNQGGSAGLRAKELWYFAPDRRLQELWHFPPPRRLVLKFTSEIPDAVGLTLHVGDVALPLPAGSGGEWSATWTGVDIDWTDGQSLAVRLTAQSADVVPADASLKSLTVSGAELSPGFAPGELVYRAVVGSGTESVTVTASANDGSATLAIEPEVDADPDAAGHQVEVPFGETLIAVTVTAEDGETQRRYRVVANRAPLPVSVSFGSASYTAAEGGDAAAVSVVLSGDPGRAVTIPLTAVAGGGAGAEDYAAPASVTFESGGALTQTVTVTAVADDTLESGEEVVLGFGTLPQGIEAGATESATVTLAEAASRNAEAAPKNTAPTGLPEISGTAQVGEVLTASVDGIADEDGLDDVTFAYQWLANGGTDDGEIAGATGTTHEVGPAEVGKALKVRVTFTDGGDTEETLTSVATEVVSARAPDAPGGLAAAPAAGREGELDVTWTAPASDGGSEVTGYKVQWKSGAEAYDGSETSTRRAVLSDPAVLTHRIEGLTVGTAYTVRVLAVNDAGDGAPAEVEATARDRVVPVLTASSVNGTVLTLTFSEALDADSRPAAVAFAVTVADDARAVDAVALTGSAVELTLASAVASGEAVTVGYTAPTGANASPLKDAAGNAVAGFTGEAVSNETAALPVVSITAGAGPVTEGAYATFTLTRTGSVSAAQTVTVEVTESGAVLAETSPEAVTFEAESATAALDLATADDEVMEDASTVTVTVAAGDGWTVDAEAGSATVTAEDDDAAPVVTTSSPIEAPENDTAVATLEATDADTPAADLVWSLAGGADEDKFAVTAVGALAFKAAKDYESPDDADGDGAYEVTVRVTDGANPVDAALKVTLADEADNSELSVADTEASEEEDSALEFVVTLDPPATATVTVDYATEDGTAASGEDYTATSGTLTFQAGEATKTISVPITDDAVNGGGEKTVTLTLSNASGADLGDWVATGTIRNSEAPQTDPALFTLTRSDSPASAIPEGETATVKVAISNGVPFTEEQTISLALSGTASSDDYEVKPQSLRLTLPAGETSVALELEALEDDEEEEAETVILTASHGGVVTGSLTVTIRSISHDATLSALSLSGIDIGTFSSAETSYSVFVEEAVETTTVTATASHPEAEVSIEPGAEVSLAAGDNEITVTVTAVDGFTTETYTVTVVRYVRPLTASFLSPPASHVGAGTFSLDLVFSEPVAISFQALKEQFQVINGEVRNARRRQGRDTFWFIKVAPSSAADMAVTLPPTTDCAAAGAVCTERGKPLSNRLTVLISGSANTRATGLPEISGTAQVGEVLTASVDGIADEDGLDDVTFAYQWLANGGTDDSEIAGATGTTHEVGPAEVGKALKVRVTFTDGGDTEETLTSVATEVVSARAPDAPGGLAAAPAAGREGELDVTWTAPASDGGSEVTGYKVQWKSGAEAYDGSETSTRRAVLSDPAVLTHRIEGLTVGTAYTVRVLAVNDAGDGAPAEAEATARDRVVPVLTASSVNGTVLTLTFSEALDADSRPAAVAFAVTVADDARAVDAVALTGSAVELTLASAVASGEAVTVGYTAPTGANASPLKDAAGNAVAGFTGEAVSNETAALPVVSITAGAGPVTEGAYATFTLTRTGSVSAAQTVTVEVTESGAVLAETSPEAVTFEAESATAALDLATADDEVMEDASTVTVTVAAGDGWTVDAEAGSATVTVEDDDAAPVVTTSSPIEAPENDTAVATLEATDADTPAADLVWSLAGGADEDKFAVTAVGALAFKAAKDYESPDDADGDGAYEVTVRVTDGANPVDAALKVTLADEDEVAPTLASASVNGTALTLTFSETLDEGSEPGTSAFGVAVSGAARQVTEVALSGSAAELTLATAVGPGETVTVGYTAPAGPDASPLKDAAGNAVAEFTGEAVSNETPALENSAPAGLPEISGTAKVGETLAASVDDIADADGLDDVTFAYQWLANGGTDDNEIAGATGTTHEVGPAEVGRTLKVRVTFTDNGDTQETLMSVATEPVMSGAPNTPATGRPVISGTLRVGETLTASRGDVADADGLAGAKFTWQWVALGPQGWQDIEGATGQSYKLRDADAGTYLRLWVSFTDGREFAERRRSATTEPVQDRTVPPLFTLTRSDSPASAIPEGETATVTVAIYNGVPFTEDQTISLALSGTASSDDYEVKPQSLRLTLPAGETSVALELEALEDDEEEEAETVILTASHGGVVAGSLTVTIRSISHDATLSALSLSGIDIGTFSSAETSYSVFVEEAVETTTVTATASHPEAEVSIEPGAEVSLAAGDNEITVTVTAVDGFTTETYTVTVVRYVRPLTAFFSSPPASHVGGGLYSLMLVFSEPVSTDFQTLMEQFQVINGEVRNARRRLNRYDNDIWWYIDVAPSSAADMAVTLPPTTDCAAVGALCTERGKPLSNRLTVLISGPANTRATGLPEISGTAQVGEVLTASVDGIADEDGLDDVTFAYQWLANGGTDDGEIAGAAGTTHEVGPAEVGKALKVRVTFTDGGDTEETLTSVATEVVSARAPDAPGGLAAAPAAGREGELDVTWTAPASDGGSEVTGYKVQWKSGAEAYDGSETSTRRAVLSDPAVLTHRIEGLTVGTAYTVRVLAVNDAGDGAPAEAEATARDRVVPVLTASSVNGTVLTLTFSEALDADSRPAAVVFAVTVANDARAVDAVALTGSAVELTLASAVASGEAVTVGYTAPTGPTGANASPLKDAAGNAVAGFTGEAVSNETAALPVVSITAGAGPVTEGAYATFTLTRTGSVSAAQTVTVEVAESGAVLAETSPEAVTFEAESATAALDLATADDEVMEDASTVTVTVAAGDGWTVDAEAGSATVTAEDDDAAPVVTTSSPIEALENDTAVATLEATDADTPAADLVWSLAGGADEDKFAVTAVGALAFKAAKDYESPDDADGDGAYEVTVRVTDGANPVDAALKVTLADEDEVAPTLASASVNGTALTLTFSETLDEGSEPGTSAFGVAVSGAARQVTEVALSGSAAELTLATAVGPGETVTVGYTAPAGPDASPLKDAAGNAVAEFTGEAVSNETPALENSAPAGLPEISGTAKVGETLAASVDDIADADGLDDVTFAYQWLANGGTDDNEIAGAAGTTHEVGPAEVGRTLKVRVTFTDNGDTQETLTSVATEEVVAAPAEVSVRAEAAYVEEGSDAVFTLTRSGPVAGALTVTVAIEESGTMLAETHPANSAFAAGEREVELAVPTVDDGVQESDSAVTARVVTGTGYGPSANFGSASVTVLDDDDDDVASPVSAGETLWSAEMQVVEITSVSIGAARADLFSNQGGSAGLRAKELWYFTPDRRLKLKFTSEIPDAVGLTLHVGDVALPLPAGSGGEWGATWTGVDIDWTDGQSLAVRLTAQSADVVPADASLKSLTVSGAELSPGFAPGELVYRAVVGSGTESVTVTASANDGSATLAIEPEVDADPDAADHQVEVPFGETLIAVTVTAEDGETQRRYRVVANRAPLPVSVSFGSASYTAAEGGDAAAVSVVLSGDPGRAVTIPLTAVAGGGAGAEDYAAPASVTFESGGALTQTVTVTAAADDTLESGEEVVLGFGTLPQGIEAGATESATVTLAEAASRNTAPTGLPEISGTAQVGEVLTASVDGIADEDGLDDVTFAYQWLANDGTDDGEIAGATGTTHEVGPAEVGKALKVRVTFTDGGDTEETLTSVATEVVSARAPDAPTGLPEIAGTPEVGATLTASVDGIEDGDGLDNATFAYQWLADDAVIDGATGTSYEVTPADVGRTLKVRVTFTDDGGAAETLDSATTEAVVDNRPTVTSVTITEPPAGGWTDGDTVQLAFGFSAAVTVTTGGGTPSVGIALDGTARQASYASGTGTTSLTFSHALTADDGTVTTLSAEADSLALGGGAIRDADGRDANLAHDGFEIIAEVIGEPEPLTASFQGVPATHDGSGSFGFELAFSEDVGTSYVTMRDDAFEVDEGDVTGARRVNGRHDLWEITVEPDGREAVSITLPGDRACGETGAVCTRGENPRALSNSPSATVAGPTVAPTVSISGGSGKEGDDSAIGFAVTLDRAAAAAVTVDYATSNGSATAGEDYTAKSGTLSFAAGVTGKTVSVLIGDDNENEGDETFTVALSNASGAVLGTSIATGMIENRHVTPLTASFGNVPAEHDGPEFTFDLTFSEEPRVGYRVLRDDAFAVTGGAVERAQRQTPGSDRRWTITVEPQGHGDVSVTLPATTDCDAEGAVCTSDGRPLSNANAATVRAMAALSAADAETTEGAGATLEFAVTLSRAAAAAVTVGYATSDGTAVAGSDYTSASGTLTFDPGETAGTVAVAVLDDSVDDDGETLTLTLSNASGARIADATATGTINNADPLPLAWLVRFGRAASDHAVEAIGARFEDAGGGAHATFAGRRLWGGGAGAGGEDAFAANPRGGATGDDAFGLGGNAFGGMQTGMDGGMGMNGGPQGGIGMNPGAATGQNAGMHGGIGINAAMNGGAALGPPGEGGYRPALRDLLIGSSFLLSADGADEAGASRRLTAWGRAAATRFDGVADGVSVDGEVATFLVGADAAWNRWLAGISVAHSVGAGGFAGADGADGELDSALTAVHPYLRYRLSDRISAWGVLGYGTGDLTLETDGSAWETDTSMRMAAAGARGVLLRGAGGLELAAKTDVRLTHITSDAAEGAAGLLGATSGAASRVRLLLEGSRPFAFGAARMLTPTLELGVRRDGGDAETGMGVDLGGSLRYADAALGLTAEAGGRYLAAHEDAGYREWGASASIRIDPGVSGRGLTLSVTPSWGADAAGGAERLWSARDARGLGGHGFDAAMRLRAEVGYGLSAFRGRGAAMPFAGVSTTVGGRDWRTGARWTRGQALEMSLEAVRRESAGAAPEHGIEFRLAWRPGARGPARGAADACPGCGDTAPGHLKAR